MPPGSRYGGSEYNGEHAYAPSLYYGQRDPERDPERYGGSPHDDYSHDRYAGRCITCMVSVRVCHPVTVKL